MYCFIRLWKLEVTDTLNLYILLEFFNESEMEYVPNLTLEFKGPITKKLKI